MASFCPKCGSPSKGTDTFCGKCGMKLADKPQSVSAPMPNAAAVPAALPVRSSLPEQTPSPRRRRPAKQTPLQKAARGVMQYVQFFLIIMIIFTLVLGILYFAAGYGVKVKAVAKIGEEVKRETVTMELTEIYETKDFVGYTVVNLAYGVMNCFLAGFAALVVVMRFLGYKGFRKMVQLYSMSGLGGNLFYLVVSSVVGTQREEYAGIEMKASIMPHFTVWITLLVFAVLLAVSILSRGKGKRR